MAMSFDNVWERYLEQALKLARTLDITFNLCSVGNAAGNATYTAKEAFMTFKSPFAINFSYPAIEVERAVSKPRFGWPVLLEEDQQGLAVLAAE